MLLFVHSVIFSRTNLKIVFVPSVSLSSSNAIDFVLGRMSLQYVREDSRDFLSEMQ